MCAQVTYSLAKRKDQTVHVPVAPAVPSWNPADSLAAPVFDDDAIAPEEELNAWSELERPETPLSTSRANRFPKRYHGIFRDRYVLLVSMLIIILFIAATLQADTKTELEEIKRMYHTDESVQPIPRGK
ncbi:hypothetical protein ABL78_1585 [Leptomonas seymouri]|uniref:Uncharacterized protein n=1 Tax=Leptomonas seymouri TaxID=5684 RepID=A0A0N1I0C5_LEPSE|nr:hypothetical protein ABL78_1585 [Leptomonas seymouri]|eukprot:KPI89252.1 hypothetical protein ABL78_1585 [Leptomonas seymouri]